MSKLYCLGELLIDFQSVGTGTLRDTKEFVKNAGGAPANVCVQAQLLGTDTGYLSKVGKDGFGDFLIGTLAEKGVDVSHVLQSGDYDTSLAFVSFKEGGEREFSFYRRTAADLHFTAEDFSDIAFEEGDALEFGSVALKTDDAKNAHDYLIRKARERRATVFFDPNLRLNLWDNEEELRRTVQTYITYADIVKIGKDELEFVYGVSAENKVRELFENNLKILLVTDGANGAYLRTRTGKISSCKGYKVKAVDTTGAGDTFFGAFIAEYMDRGQKNDIGTLADILNFACMCGAYTTTNFGAIPAMGNKEQIYRAVK